MSHASPTRIAVLISGRGSNCMAIIRAVRDGRLHNAEVAVVVSNIPGAPGIEAARAFGVPVVTLEGRGREQVEHETAILALLRKFRVDMICLAGYMRVLSASFVREWQDRLINIHPSLLPSFPGLHAQRKALEHGVTVAGCTVHFVDESVDGGVIILQRCVDVEPTDNEETLSARILEQEHVAYVDALNRVLSNEWEVQGRRYVRKS